MSDTRPLRLVPPPVPVLRDSWWGARLYRGRHRLVVPYEFRAGAMGLLVMCSLVASLSVLQIAHAYEQATGWTAKVLPPILKR